MVEKLVQIYARLDVVLARTPPWWHWPSNHGTRTSSTVGGPVMVLVLCILSDYVRRSTVVAVVLHVGVTPREQPPVPAHAPIGEGNGEVRVHPTTRGTWRRRPEQMHTMRCSHGQRKGGRRRRQRAMRCEVNGQNHATPVQNVTSWFNRNNRLLVSTRCTFFQKPILNEP